MAPTGPDPAHVIDAPNGKVYFVPRNENRIGELELGNKAPAYEVAGGVPEAWNALLSPNFNKGF